MLQYYGYFSRDSKTGFFGDKSENTESGMSQQHHLVQWSLLQGHQLLSVVFTKTILIWVATQKGNLLVNQILLIWVDH